MRSELVIKGRSLTGTSDLTLIAPLREGLVPSLDAISYKTRILRLMKTLQGGRASLHEYAVYRPLSDAVERVAAIQSFRVAVLDRQSPAVPDQVMLAVTFDGTWESYIRVLWQKVGTLLDIIFCNTEGYVVSHMASFDDWAGWVRRVQVETSFYFNTHALTVPDVAYLRTQEAALLAPGPMKARDRDLLAVRQHAVSAEARAWEASQTTLSGGLETLRQGLQSLAVLFRLTDSYLPGTPDGEILRRAALDLLHEFQPLAAGPHLPALLEQPMRARFDRQLKWLATPCAGRVETPRGVPTLPETVDTRPYANLQSGIVRPHEGMTHGSLLLLAVDDPLAGMRLLDRLIARCRSEADRAAPGALALNVAVTYEGLRALGLDEAQLALFPQEFREGMEARASMLGDFRANHPRRWKLPLRNWPGPTAAGPTPAAAGLRVELSTVHLVVQLRVASSAAEIDATLPGHPLHAETQALLEDAPGRPARGIRLLRVDGLRRLVNAQQQPSEHFGFVDGNSDPVFNRAEAGQHFRNQAHLGDFILGHDSVADLARPPQTPLEQARDDWLRDGSFLVVRKLRQHVHRLQQVLQTGARETGLPAAELAARMMGRRYDGQPLVKPARGLNDFNYEADPQGRQCPFHAHIRRANPRQPDPDQPVFAPPQRPGARPPRLLRRGMSYGPTLQENPDPDGAERGLFFMAYNASIAEQFEVVQRWISGGNAAGGSSRQGDPFLGVPEIGEQRSFRFEARGRVHRLALDAAPALDALPQPLVELEWGLYLFTPSLPVLRRLRNTAAAARRPAPVWSADEGREQIRALRRIETEQGAAAALQAWKTALEDPEAQEKFHAASLWAAIRRDHGGALHTPYGVLVADAELVDAVLADTTGYSVAGYRERMAASIGEIFLGLDGDDPDYAAQSQAVTQALMAIPLQQAFAHTLQLTRDTLQLFVGREQGMAAMRGLPRWELNLDAKEVSDAVLARLCQDWFGLPDLAANGPLVPGSWRWDWREEDPPIYPAHFTAPSRYIFQPWPNAQVQDYGQRIGRALTAALARFLAPHRAAGTVPQTPGTQNPAVAPQDAPLARAILAAFPGPANDALAARSFCGALMGFLPTVDGNFRLALNEWLRDGSFWSLRAAWDGVPGATEFDRALQLLRPPLVQAMQLRPSPELIWRRVRRPGLRIGHLQPQVGDTVVLALVSAAQQKLAQGAADVHAVFGGDRRARAHPTHACPGYAAGMGVLLGLMTGLLSAPQPMRGSPAPLSFTFEGLL